MMLYDRRVRLLASCLSAVAGYVDAIGFLMTGGFFVSFMSGNTTRLGIGLAEVSSHAAFAAGLIVTFVAGAAFGALAGRLAGRARRPVVLLFVAGLLGCAAVLDGIAADHGAITLIVLAMGAENTVFAEDGEVRIGLTYMTGTLVKLGKRLTATLFGGDRFGWAPLLLLWMGLLTGAVLGAVAYRFAGAQALWAAAGVMSLLAVVAIAIGPDAREELRGPSGFHRLP